MLARKLVESYIHVQNYWERFDTHLQSIVFHFNKAIYDSTRDKHDKCTYDDLKRKITSTEFLMGLVMCDT